MTFENLVGEERLRVLVVEKAPVEAGSICHMLSASTDPGFEVRCAGACTEALDLLASLHFDMALVDDSLGEEPALDLLRAAKSAGIDVPFVFTSEQPSHEGDLRAMEAGAVYYLDKQLLAGRTLERVVRYSGRLNQTREALRESEAHTRVLLDSAVDGMVTIDADGIIHTFNPAASRIFGYDPGDVVGRNVKMLMPSPYREEHDGYLQRYLSTGEARVIGIGREVIGRRKDGSEFPLHLGISEVRYGRGRRFLGILRDLTEQRRALAHAQQRERLADIGAITARIVHDIGNPVAGIAMQTQLLLLRLDKDPAIPGSSLRKSIERIQASTKHLDTLVKEFLDFSREQRLNLREVRLPELLEEIVANWQILAAHQNIRITAEVTDDLPPLMLDAEKIRRVFDNLIRNAVEAIGQGPGVVCVRAYRSEAARVEITVEDTGPGIPPEIQPFRLFETTKENGTGLGLAIVRQFVEAHGGSVGYEAREPNGTVFRIELP